MRKAGLTQKLQKCEFAQPCVTFVGHMFGSGLHGPDPTKIACVQTKKPPVSNKDARSLDSSDIPGPILINLQRQLNHLRI